jgi:L,D-transpeptidase catalytic domain
MRTLLRLPILALLTLASGLTAAQAEMVIRVDKSAQHLSVAVDGATRYDWPVSTARWGYETPNGTYRPQRLEKTWYSRKYEMSPMPHSIFFDGGYAIHGSYEVSHLGRPASHGCIRLSPAHAATLFALVQEHRGETKIVVTGERPAGYEVAHRSQQPAPQYEYARESYPSYRYNYNYGGAYGWRVPSRGGWIGNNGGW